MEKKKSIVIIIIILVLIVASSVRLYIEEKSISEYEKNVNKITEIDYSEQQKVIDEIVEKGKMNVNYSSKAVFNGKVSELFNIKNIKNNHYPIIFEIIDENGDLIYVSKKIEPGFEMNNIELEKELTKGTHECQIKVGYAEEGNVSSIFPITIEVK